MSSQYQHHVFLSYSRKDTHIMRRVRASLEAEGLSVWTDEDSSMSPGTADWTRSIEDALDRAGCVVVILSPDAKDSPWVREELNYARGRDIRIFAVLARGTQSTAVPFGFTLAQRVDIQVGYDTAIHRLVLAIYDYLDIERLISPVVQSYQQPRTPVQPPPTRGQKQRQSRKPPSVTVIVLLFALAITLFIILLIIWFSNFLQGDNRDKAPTISITESANPVVFIPTSEASSVVEDIFYTPIFSATTEHVPWTPYTKTFNDIEMVLVPEGCFYMGDSYEGGLQCFDYRFWIDKYEVSYGQYDTSISNEVANRPQTLISWFDALTFCNNRGGRLPSEAEWEYAARGPEALLYPWGDEFVPANVVYRENSGGLTSDVGSRSAGASWVGALDMSGNVWEWTSSRSLDYPYARDDGREDEFLGIVGRSIRGGAFTDDATIVRSAFRYQYMNDARSDTIGFRCARDYNPVDLN